MDSFSQNIINIFNPDIAPLLLKSILDCTIIGFILIAICIITICCLSLFIDLELEARNFKPEMIFFSIGSFLNLLLLYYTVLFV